MWSIYLFVLVLYLSAFTGGILLIRYIVIQFKSKKIANRLSLILAILSICLFAGVIIKDRLDRSYYIEFQYSKDIKVELSAFEPESFQDCPVDFEICFLNSKDELIKKYEFTSDTPLIKFQQDSLNENFVIIKSYGPGSGANETIQLKSSIKPLFKSFSITLNYGLIKEKFET